MESVCKLAASGADTPFEGEKGVCLALLKLVEATKIRFFRSGHNGRQSTAKDFPEPVISKKVMVIFFFFIGVCVVVVVGGGGNESIILRNNLERGTKVNSERYIETREA